MKLTEKGRIQPPPTMSTYPEMVSKEVQKWKNVISATHWDLYNPNKVDGADFYVGDEELGHIHLNGQVHLATSIELRDILLSKGKAKKIPFGGEYARWIQYQIKDEETAWQAIELFKLNYERLLKEK